MDKAYSRDLITREEINKDVDDIIEELEKNVHESILSTGYRRDRVVDKE